MTHARRWTRALPSGPWTAGLPFRPWSTGCGPCRAPGTGTVFVSPYNSLVESYKQLVVPTDPCTPASPAATPTRSPRRPPIATTRTSAPPITAVVSRVSASTSRCRGASDAGAAWGSPPCSSGRVCDAMACPCGGRRQVIAVILHASARAHSGEGEGSRRAGAVRSMLENPA